MDASSLANDRPLGVAILAMGGQGGGVLADWIVALAEGEGWIAQGTSVPGVAQRTGATIYYVEMIRPRAALQPVLSLMPVPGDVDVVIAAEMMEAGRAIQRGIVSPDRTTLIASTHRSYSVNEKGKPGNGAADPVKVEEAAHALSARFFSADMQRIAEKSGSVISAALFGALAASGALPFARERFEDTIRAAGVGVDGSLRAFAAGFDAVRTPNTDAPPATKSAPSAIVGGTEAERGELTRALARIDAGFPSDAREMLRVGLARMVDYQDVAYGHEYLDRVASITAIAPELAFEAARQIAVAYAYDDVIRVADLKTRASRFARVRGEVSARAEQIVDTTEFMHPRVEEVCATLPAKLGAWVEGSALAKRALGIVFNRGRRVRTTSIIGFTQLWIVASLRPRRRTLLRHRREMIHVNAWLALVETCAATDPAFARELLKCRRLVKGYSDTHARGQSKFDRVLAVAGTLAARPDAADWTRRLVDAALADEDGKILDGALRTVATLEREAEPATV
jgi:indolepyruvate ferredoxin oxidoreductase beta subunit